MTWLPRRPVTQQVPPAYVPAWLADPRALPPPPAPLDRIWLPLAVALIGLAVVAGLMVVRFG
jgi:hypothetical protein